jgi:hypothetical protein
VDFSLGLNAAALVAERRILEGMAEGRFDRLPGRGKPQVLEDASGLAPEDRLVGLILKNAGYLEQARGEDLCSALRKFSFPSSSGSSGAGSPRRESSEEGEFWGRLARLERKLSLARRKTGRAGPAKAAASFPEEPEGFGGTGNSPYLERLAAWASPKGEPKGRLETEKTRP